MDRLCPGVFKRMFRVNRDTFHNILDRILPHFPSQDEQKAINSSGAPIELQTILAVTLCWLAGASFLDLCFAQGISCSTFYHPKGVLWPILEALDAACDIEFPFDDACALEALSCGFWEHSSSILDSCVLQSMDLVYLYSTTI